MRPPVLLVLAASAVLSSVGGAGAAFTLDGDSKALTLVVEEGSRREIVQAILDRCKLEALGGTVVDGPINGKFEGSLSEVLKAILPANGYAIAYADGLPVRVTFTAEGTSPMASSEQFANPMVPQPEPAPSAPLPRKDVRKPEPPLITRVLERGALAQVSPAASENPQPDESQPQADMQQQIADATARAVQELKALTGALQKSSN